MCSIKKCALIFCQRYSLRNFGKDLRVWETWDGKLLGTLKFLKVTMTKAYFLFDFTTPKKIYFFIKCLFTFIL